MKGGDSMKKTYLLRFALSLPLSKLYALMFRPYTAGMELRNPYNFRAPLFNTGGAIRMENLLKNAVKRPKPSSKFDEAVLRSGEMHVEVSLIEETSTSVRNLELVASLDDLAPAGPIREYVAALNGFENSEAGTYRTWIEDTSEADRLLVTEALIPVVEGADLFRTSYSIIHEAISFVKNRVEFAEIDVDEIAERLTQVYIQELLDEAELVPHVAEARYDGEEFGTLTSDSILSGDSNLASIAPTFETTLGWTEQASERKATLESVHTGYDTATTTFRTTLLHEDATRAEGRLGVRLDEEDFAELVTYTQFQSISTSLADKLYELEKSFEIEDADVFRNVYEDFEQITRAEVVQHVHVQVLENGEVRLEVYEHNLENADVRLDVFFHDIEDSEIRMETYMQDIGTASPYATTFVHMNDVEGGNQLDRLEGVIHEVEDGMVVREVKPMDAEEFAERVTDIEDYGRTETGSTFKVEDAVVLEDETSTRYDLLDAAVVGNESGEIFSYSFLAAMESAGGFDKDAVIQTDYLVDKVIDTPTTELIHLIAGSGYDSEGIIVRDTLANGYDRVAYIERFAETDYIYTRSIDAYVERWYEVDNISPTPVGEIYELSTPIRYEREIGYIQDFSFVYYPTIHIPETIPDHEILAVRYDDIVDTDIERFTAGQRYDSTFIHIADFAHTENVSGNLGYIQDYVLADNDTEVYDTTESQTESGWNRVSTRVEVNLFTSAIEYPMHQVYPLSETTSAEPYDADKNTVPIEFEGAENTTGVPSVNNDEFALVEPHVDYRDSRILEIEWFKNTKEDKLFDVYLELINPGRLYQDKIWDVNVYGGEDAKRVRDIFDTMVAEIEGQNTGPVFDMYLVEEEGSNGNLLLGDAYMTEKTDTGSISNVFDTHQMDTETSALEDFTRDTHQIDTETGLYIKIYDSVMHADLEDSHRILPVEDVYMQDIEQSTHVKVDLPAIMNDIEGGTIQLSDFNVVYDNIEGGTLNTVERLAVLDDDWDQATVSVNEQATYIDTEQASSTVEYETTSGPETETASNSMLRDVVYNDIEGAKADNILDDTHMIDTETASSSAIRNTAISNDIEAAGSHAGFEASLEPNLEASSSNNNWDAVVSTTETMVFAQTEISTLNPVEESELKKEAPVKLVDHYESGLPTRDDPVIMNDIEGASKDTERDATMPEIEGAVPDIVRDSIQNDVEGATSDMLRDSIQNDIEGAEPNIVEDSIQNDIEGGAPNMVRDSIQNDIEGAANDMERDSIQNDIEGGAPNIVRDSIQNDIEGGKPDILRDSIQNDIEGGKSANQYEATMPEIEFGVPDILRDTVLASIEGAGFAREEEATLPEIEGAEPFIRELTYMQDVEGATSFGRDVLLVGREEAALDRLEDISLQDVETSRLLDKFGVIIVGETSEIYPLRDVELADDEIAVLLDKEGVILEETTSEILMPHITAIAEFTEAERKKKRRRARRPETELGVGKKPTDPWPPDPPDPTDPEDPDPDPDNPEPPRDNSKKTIWLIMGRPNTWSGWDWKKTR